MKPPSASGEIMRELEVNIRRTNYITNDDGRISLLGLTRGYYQIILPDIHYKTVGPGLAPARVKPCSATRRACRTLLEFVDALLQVLLQHTLQFRHSVRIEVAIKPDAAIPVPFDGRTPLAAAEDRLKRRDIPAQETADLIVNRGVYRKFRGVRSIPIAAPPIAHQFVAWFHPIIKL